MSKERYTLFYLVKRFDKKLIDSFSRWEKMNFKTLKEANMYFDIVDGNAYIVDNVTGKEIINNFRKNETNNKAAYRATDSDSMR